MEQLSQLTNYQLEKVKEQINKYLGLNQKIENHSPCFCPKCGRQDARFIRKGFSNGKQRYQCKSCLKKFTFDANYITSWSHQSTDKWIVAIEDTLTLKSIQSLSDGIGVCRNTAFAMRHKILHALEIAISKEKTLDDLIEADETYALESQKGIKVLNRKPRKHGSKANKRGLSSEQICICVAVDRSGATIAKSVNCIHHAPWGQSGETYRGKHF